MTSSASERFMGLRIPDIFNKKRGSFGEYNLALATLPLLVGIGELPYKPPSLDNIVHAFEETDSTCIEKFITGFSAIGHAYNWYGYFQRANLTPQRVTAEIRRLDGELEKVVGRSSFDDISRGLSYPPIPDFSENAQRIAFLNMHRMVLEDLIKHNQGTDATINETIIRRRQRLVGLIQENDAEIAALFPITKGRSLVHDKNDWLEFFQWNFKIDRSLPITAYAVASVGGQDYYFIVIDSGKRPALSPAQNIFFLDQATFAALVKMKDKLTRIIVQLRQNKNVNPQATEERLIDFFINRWDVVFPFLRVLYARERTRTILDAISAKAVRKNPRIETVKISAGGDAYQIAARDVTRYLLPYLEKIILTGRENPKPTKRNDLVTEDYVHYVHLGMLDPDYAKTGVDLIRLRPPQYDPLWSKLYRILLLAGEVQDVSPGYLKSHGICKPPKVQPAGGIV